MTIILIQFLFCYRELQCFVGGSFQHSGGGGGEGRGGFRPVRKVRINLSNN